jgi:hypothetical protein
VRSVRVGMDFTTSSFSQKCHWDEPYHRTPKQHHLEGEKDLVSLLQLLPLTLISLLHFERQKEEESVGGRDREWMSRGSPQHHDLNLWTSETRRWGTKMKILTNKNTLREDESWDRCLKSSLKKRLNEILRLVEIAGDQMQLIEMVSIIRGDRLE